MKYKIEQKYTASDVAALFLVHTVLKLILPDQAENLPFLDCKINQISNSWRTYFFSTAMNIPEIEMELEFGLFKEVQLKTPTQPFQTRWVLQQDGLVAKVKVKDKEYQLKFFGEKTLAPDTQSEAALQELRESMK